MVAFKTMLQESITIRRRSHQFQNELKNIQRWQRPYTAVAFICSIMWKILSYFLGLKVFNLDNSALSSYNRNAQVAFVEKPQYNIYFLIDGRKSGIIPSLRRGSFKITLTVP